MLTLLAKYQSRSINGKLRLKEVGELTTPKITHDNQEGPRGFRQRLIGLMSPITPTRLLSGVLAS